MPIYRNKIEISPFFNGSLLSRVMYNSSQIYPVKPEEPSAFTPDEAPDGIYIYASDGKLYDTDSRDISMNDSALGVAVVSGDVKFAISKELPMKNYIRWSSTLYEIDMDGILTATSQSAAIRDYAGQSNTNIIRTQASSENSNNNAAHYCYSQTLNGQNGYLPAAGELAIIYDNKSDIDNALVLIGSKSISDRCDEFQTQYKPYFLSSTESSDGGSDWILLWEDNPLNFGSNSKYDSGSHLNAFPVFPLYPYPTIFIGDNITRPFTEETLSSLLQPYIGTEYRLVVEDMVQQELTPFMNYFMSTGTGGNDKLHLVMNSNSIVSIPASYMTQISVKSVDLRGMTVLNQIGGYYLAFCSELNSVKLPDGLAEIGGSSFASCSQLTEINIPNSVESIGSYAFASCENLEKLTIGALVTNIEVSAFYMCSNLKDISFYGTNEPSIGISAFSNVVTTVKVPKDYTGTKFGVLDIEKVL